MGKVDLTILVPAWNEERNITSFLSDIADQLNYSSFKTDVIILANGCVDNTIPLAKSHIQKQSLPNVSWLIQVFDDPFKNKVLNAGIELAKSDIILNLDADSRLEKNCISRLYSFLLDNPKVNLVGGLDIPIYDKLNKETLLYQFQRTQQIWREERGRVMAIGAVMMYRKSSFNGFPLDAISEDTWLSLYIASKFGWESVKVLMDANIHIFAPTSWSDYLKQQTRWDTGYVQLMKNHPELQSTYDNRRSLFKRRSNEEIFESVYNRLDEEKIARSRLVELRDIINIIIEENSDIEYDSILRNVGTWDPIISTKGA